MNNNLSLNSNQLTTVSVYNGTKQQPRQARQVISEEAYTDTLSAIIIRDYFPAIPSLSRDVAVLERRKEGDFAGAVAVRKAARKLAMHEEELAQIEREEEDSAIKGIRTKPRPLHRESVDGFHARVTSEDNQDFELQMRKDVEKRRERMQLIYNSCGTDASKVEDKLRILNHSGTQDHNKTGTSCLPLLTSLQCSQQDDDTFAYASDRFNPPRDFVHVAGTSADGKHSTEFKNSLFFTPVHHSLVELSNTSAVHNLDCDTKLCLMPPPRARPIGQAIEKFISKDTTYPLVEYVAKPVEDREKRIVASQTRFPYQNDSRLAHESLFSSRDHPTWSDIESSDYNSTDLDEPIGPIETERRKRQRKLNKERSTFVAMTPLIIPGERSINTDHPSGDPNSSPILTWGQVASTPMVIGQSSAVKTLFSRKDPSEHLARIAEDTLAQKAKRYKDASVFRENDRDSGKTRSDSLALTPKAQQLLKRIGSTPRSSAFRKALRESYSSTPSRRKERPSSTTKNISLKDTPLHSS